MAEKETLQNDNNILIYLLISIVISLPLTWLFINQSFFLELAQPLPDLEFKGLGILLVFFGLGLSIVSSLYFLWEKKWRFFFLSIAICSVLFVFKDGELYNPTYLYYLLKQYSYGVIPDDIYVWGGIYFFGVTIFVYAAIKPSNEKPKYAHGTAEVQYGDHYVDSNFKAGANGNLLIGRHKKTNKILSVDPEGHLLTMAPTQSGKGVGTIIPNLINYPHTVITVDPKGENCNFTAEHRQKHFGQKIICLDPFRESIWAKENGTNHFNPLDSISNTFQKAFRPCNALVSTIFSQSAKEDPFWSKRAENLYLGFLIYICTAPEYNDSKHPEYSPELRNLSTVNHLFSIPSEDLLAYIHKISVSDVPLQVKRFANEFISAGDSVKMLAGLTETLKGEIQLFNSPEISEVMKYSDFSYDEVAMGNATIYLIIPTEELRTYSKWTRIVLTIFIHRAIFVRKSQLLEARKRNMMFLIDEFTNLGKLDIVRDNYSIAGGYGIKFWIIFQDIQQLKMLYEKSWASFFSNAEVKQVFGISEIDTAEYISRTLGETTIVSVSKNINKNLGFKAGGGKGISRTEQKRRLYTPDELMCFQKNLQFIFARGERPIISSKITYYQDESFKIYAPNETQVFQRLIELPQLFDIQLEGINIENSLRLIIHGRPNRNSSNDSDTDESSNEMSMDPNGSHNIDVDDLGDDFDLSPF